METLTAKNKYGTYCIPTSSRQNASAKCLLNGGVWEPETIDFIKKYCTHDLIHAGTYFGDMLPAFSEINKVWAFEPRKENYECALKTIEMNKLTNINLTNAALGEEAKTVEFMIERDGKVLGGGSKVIDRSTAHAGDQELGRMGKEHKSIKVPMVTIDDTIPHDSDISIIHLDVELYELIVLHGAVDTIKRCSPFLILETHWGDINDTYKGSDRTNPELLEFLSSLNYKRYTKEKIHRENTVWKRNI